jgi:hypothetical protein
VISLKLQAVLLIIFIVALLFNHRTLDFQDETTNETFIVQNTAFEKARVRFHYIPRAIWLRKEIPDRWLVILKNKNGTYVIESKHYFDLLKPNQTVVCVVSTQHHQTQLRIHTWIVHKWNSSERKIAKIY